MIELDNNHRTNLAPEVSRAMRAAEASTPDEQTSTNTAVGAAKRLVGASEYSCVIFTNDPENELQDVFSGWLNARQEGSEIIATPGDNEAVLAAFAEKGFKIRLVGLERSGLPDMNEFRSLLNERTAIVSIGHASKVTGAVFPIIEIAALVREHSEAMIYVDGSQAAGKTVIDIRNVEIDLYSINASLFHGPSVHAVFSPRHLRKMAVNASCSDLVGFTVAAELAADLSETVHVRTLRDRLVSEILEKIPNSRLIGPVDPATCLPNTAAISFESTNGEAIMARLLNAGIRVTTSSVCSEDDHLQCPTLTAMNIPFSEAMGTMQFSLSRYTGKNEIDRSIEVLPGIIADLRRIAGVKG